MEIVKLRGGDVEMALTLATTVDDYPDLASQQQLVRLTEQLLPIQVHHLLMFANELKVSVRFAQHWLRSFGIDLTNDDGEVDDAIEQSQQILEQTAKTVDTVQRLTNEERLNFARESVAHTRATGLLEIAELLTALPGKARVRS